MAIEKRKKGSGFLAKLRRDQAGNTIAIFAAAIFPAIGLIGGGVDMSRIYLVNTRLQAACDAGSLMGRKVMASGSWSDDSNLANTRANQMFDTNFAPGAYGTNTLSRSFTEVDGNVMGAASVVVPMTLMKVFEQEDRTVTVNCQSELRIPDTDIMFVLDVTGSMGKDDGNPTTRIHGLRVATKCFYESLAKVNISDVSPAECGETNDPVDLNQGAVRLRFGFVPYNVNVNVGKLLPLDYIADSRVYQSREAEFVTVPGETVHTPTIGTESGYTLTGTSTSGNGNWSSWQGLDHSIERPPYYYSWYVDAKKSQCGQLTPPSDESSGGSGGSGSYVLVSQSPSNLSYPTSTITKTYEVTTGSGTTYSYRYKWGQQQVNGRKRKGCFLQRRSRTSSAVETYTTTTPVTWESDTETTSQEFDRWVYKPVTHDISGLKDTSNNAWNSSVTLPLGDEGSMEDIAWDGCIEERQTFQNTDSDPSDDWDPIPADALDLDIDLVPDTSDASTLWGAILPGAVYSREKKVSGDWEKTTETFNSDESDYDEDSYKNDVSCPTEAKLYQTWTPTAFSTYLNNLDPGGRTYHDIGLLWGARLMSPTGIFSNITNDTDEAVERHMVFMTDGDTVAGTDDYTAYGINWWDRRQTDSGANRYTAIVDARAQAICREVKNRNITLWVVSYGPGVGTDTDAALEECASDGKFFKATNSLALITQFKGIAAEISNLRLTE